MKVKEVLDKIIFFETLIENFYQDWFSFYKDKNSMSLMIRGFSPINTVQLKKQSKILLQEFGILKPYLGYLDEDLGYLDEGSKILISLERIISTFDYSYNFPKQDFHLVVSKLNQIIGYLKTIPLEEVLPFLHNNYRDLGDSMENYLNFLHPVIQNSSVKLFLDTHYSESVEAASKAINQYIRDKTGVKKDGTHLITEIFSPNNPILAFSDLSTDTLKSEQQGFMEMLKGFMTGVRNPLAHSPAKPEDPQKTFEYLVMTSLFCRRIDDTFTKS
ncbi:TIGR02391 family protein [Nodularia sp. UHCC 0506]|uniref:TIGR02391 family protein n=1 Tax=Nodularia sp. UHCC 0506 TaxID=3110243 RepID=UPI002B21078D|nr:TIGR02391 family protein [Nodularia sp. UHCC 0506]MEA5516605.1 TIGR02391 family protein [Nodularia sp. UHCC 0506]